MLFRSVYCGASPGADPLYADAARGLARVLVSRNIGLVYGGGKVGLMGVIADEVLRLGGEATGVIPRALLEREVGHTGLTRQFVVKDMHERKAMMSDLADGFIAMPGGMGTLEELFEMVDLLGDHAPQGRAGRRVLEGDSQRGAHVGASIVSTAKLSRPAGPLRWINRHS